MTNRKVWIVSGVTLIACIILTVFLYIRTGNLFIAILIAPPIIYYALKYKGRKGLSD